MTSAIVMLAVVAAARKPLSKFGNWFTAERGTGEGKNGWV